MDNSSEGTKTELERKRIYEQTNYQYWNWIRKFKTPNNQKPRTNGFTGEFYQAFKEELTIILLKLFQKNCRERNSAKLILWGHCHPNNKTRQRYHKKRKLQANITDEHRDKNTQQNTSKSTPAIQYKDHTPWSKRFLTGVLDFFII